MSEGLSVSPVTPEAPAQVNLESLRYLGKKDIIPLTVAGGRVPTDSSSIC